MTLLAGWIVRALRGEYAAVRAEVEAQCLQFPVPGL
jgi:hypothetical protein